MKKIFLLLCVLVLGGCSIAKESNPEITVPSNENTPNIEVATAYPVITINQVPTWYPISTDFVDVQSTNESETSPSLGWVLVRDEDLGFAMKIPSAWKAEDEKSWYGIDGRITYQARNNYKIGINALCQMEANTNESIGIHPRIWLWNNPFGFNGCAILPSSDAVNPDVILLAYFPEKQDPGYILEINLPLKFWEQIGKEIQPLNAGLTPTPSPSVKLDNDYEFNTYEEIGLRIEEYRMTSDEWYQSHGWFSFPGLVPEEAQERKTEIRGDWRSKFPEINEQLVPFDVHIYSDTITGYKAPTLRLGAKYPGPKSIYLRWVGNFVMNISKTKFFLEVTELDTSYRYLVTENEILKLDHRFSSYLGHAPTHVFSGDDLLEVIYKPIPTGGIGSTLQAEVLKNGEKIFSFIPFPFTPAGDPVRGLYVYENHWYLESADVLIRDGVMLNKLDGIGEYFTFRMMNGKPFYFYRQGEDVFLSYDFKTMPVKYQVVMHDPMCCDASRINMMLVDDGMGFYAMRDGSWYYVIITTNP